MHAPPARGQLPASCSPVPLVPHACACACPRQLPPLSRPHRFAPPAHCAHARPHTDTLACAPFAGRRPQTLPALPPVPIPSSRVSLASSFPHPTAQTLLPQLPSPGIWKIPAAATSLSSNAAAHLHSFPMPPKPQKLKRLSSLVVPHPFPKPELPHGNATVSSNLGRPPLMIIC
ncbi:hypothetical protein PVAP13_J160950 [Panicum virgatum]|nr:hypothetical protein PVAP13_J160950 [Panicum virgatum]